MSHNILKNISGKRWLVQRMPGPQGRTSEVSGGLCRTQEHYGTSFSCSNVLCRLVFQCYKAAIALSLTRLARISWNASDLIQPLVSPEKRECLRAKVTSRKMSGNNGEAKTCSENA